MPADNLAQSRSFTIYRQTLTEVVQDLQSLPAPTAVIGQEIDSKYVLDKLIGQGGMGAVYAATHILLKKPVALKTLLSRQIDAESFERFRREALSLGKIRHRNIVEVFDFGIADERPYFTMELLSGSSLSDFLKRKGPLEISQALYLFEQVADALDHAHRLNIIHRDIKPGNIFLDCSGSNKLVKIVDFGIAKLSVAGNSSGAQYETRTGTIFGSPLYMSPEQSTGLPIDGRSDIYSFGCSLFEALTGKPPFVGADALQTIMAHQVKAAPRLAEIAPSRHFDERLEKFVSRLLAKDPADRYQTFADVQRDLTDCKQNASRASSLTVSERPVLEDDEPTNTSSNLKPIIVVLSVLAILSVVFVGVFIAGGALLGARPEVKAAAPVEPVVVTPAPKAAPPIKITKTIKGAVTTFTFSRNVPRVSFGFYRPTSLSDMPQWPCVDAITIPTQASGFMLYCNGVVDPEFLKALPPNTFDTVRLRGNGWEAEHLEEIAKQKTVKRLYLRQSDLSREAIAVVKKMHDLTLLDFSESNVDGTDLVPLNQWPKLDRLFLNHVTNAGRLIQNDDAPKTIVHLHLNGDDLTDADLVHLRKFPNLALISLDGNKINGSGLSMLTNLPLTNLDLANMPVGPACIEPLSKMPKLVGLSLSPIDWKQSDIKLLRSKLAHPQCWSPKRMSSQEYFGEIR